MNASDPVDRRHWDAAYVQKGEAGVSWFEETPTVSLDLIKALPGPKDSLIDVGGGASRLAAYALWLGFGHVAVLDLSGEAITRSQAAIGGEADRVEWIVANVTPWKPGRRYDVWHDRAAFHFLTDEADLAATLGPRFKFVNGVRHEHQTPSGSMQAFQFSVLERTA